MYIENGFHAKFYLPSCRLVISLALTLSYIKKPHRGVMVSVLSSSVLDRGFEHRSGQTKDDKIGICCFYAKHATLRR
jgi:hypothetical protein